ncbi:serine protease [Undibacterium sp.]|uniref:serine protease n=1 Tax=Undibacterium sp. TaxID=1914977 RepID=UPI0037509C8B
MPNPQFHDYADRIRKALVAYKKDEAVRACRDLVAALTKAGVQFTETDAVDLLKLLRSHRYFDLMRDVSDAFISSGMSNVTVQRQHAQALIELGDFGSSKNRLDSLISTLPSDHPESYEAQGLLGRLHKQRYVNASADLQNAFANYWAVYDRDRSQYWHAANVLALAKLAVRDKVRLPVPIDIKLIARDVRNAVKKLQKPSHWDIATSAEAALAAGNIVTARKDYLRFVEHKETDAFAVGSALRQLNEVWQLGGAPVARRALIQLLSSKLLHLKGGEVELSGKQIESQLSVNTGEYQKIYGAAATVTLDWYLKGLSRCENIARIGRDPTRGIGSGFLMKGERLSPAWKDRTVLVTNAHVVSDDPSDESTSHTEAQAFFERRHGLVSRFTEVLWSSKKTELDTTVLGLEEEIEITMEYPIARAMPVNTPESRIYVIGHPGGGTLSFSLQDNELVNYNDAHIWYRTPTEGGSSGSPIFNSQWELVGVHHKGGAPVASVINGESVEANEGLRWSAIRKAIENH